MLCRWPCYRSICRECTNACIPAVFQQVCLTLANNFSTGLWLSTALCCISVAHLQPEIECHADGHVIDQSAVRGHVAALRSNGDCGRKIEGKPGRSSHVPDVIWRYLDLGEIKARGKPGNEASNEPSPARVVLQLTYVHQCPHPHRELYSNHVPCLSTVPEETPLKSIDTHEYKQQVIVVT